MRVLEASPLAPPASAAGHAREVPVLRAKAALALHTERHRLRGPDDDGVGGAAAPKDVGIVGDAVEGHDGERDGGGGGDEYPW